MSQQNFDSLEGSSTNHQSHTLQMRTETLANSESVDRIRTKKPQMWNLKTADNVSFLKIFLKREILPTKDGKSYRP